MCIEPDLHVVWENHDGLESDFGSDQQRRKHVDETFPMSRVKWAFQTCGCNVHVGSIHPGMMTIAGPIN